MKPFDLEKAKKGAPVCTRSGKKARILAFDANHEEGYNIVALEENEDGFEEVITVDNNGSFTHGKDEAEEDLFMKEIVGYCALFKDSKGVIFAENVYPEFEPCQRKIESRYDHEFFCYAKVELFYNGEEDQK